MWCAWYHVLLHLFILTACCSNINSCHNFVWLALNCFGEIIDKRSFQKLLKNLLVFYQFLIFIIFVKSLSKAVVLRRLYQIHSQVVCHLSCCHVFFKSSHRRCSIEKVVFKNFAKFTGKDMCQSLFLIEYKVRLTWVRSSHQRCSARKVVLRKFAKFPGKHLCQSIFFNKVAGLGLIIKQNKQTNKQTKKRLETKHG